MRQKIDITADHFIEVHTSIENRVLDNIPVLAVNHMKHGRGQHGSVGIFADIGTEAFISKLSVECTD